MIEDLYNRYYRELFAWCKSMTGGKEALSEDLIQEVFLRAMKRYSRNLARNNVARGYTEQHEIYISIMYVMEFLRLPQISCQSQQRKQKSIQRLIALRC